MKDCEFEFQFDGPQAEDDAQALIGFLAKELPKGAARVVHRQQQRSDAEGSRDLRTTIEIVTVVLAAVSAAKDGIDLAAPLIAWAKERRARRQRIPYVTLPLSGLKTSLDKAPPEQLRDALTGQGRTDMPHRT